MCLFQHTIVDSMAQAISSSFQMWEALFSMVPYVKHVSQRILISKLLNLSNLITVHSQYWIF